MTKIKTISRTAVKTETIERLKSFFSYWNNVEAYTRNGMTQGRLISFLLDDISKLEKLIEQDENHTGEYCY